LAAWAPVLPDTFGHKIPKLEKYIYVPNGHKIFQMAIKYANNFHFLGAPKFTQIGMKLYHLATMLGTAMTLKIPEEEFPLNSF
jgi:hypothetical protein